VIGNVGGVGEQVAVETGVKVDHDDWSGGPGVNVGYAGEGN